MTSFQTAWLASVPTKWEQPTAPKRKPIEAWANVYATEIVYHETQYDATEIVYHETQYDADRRADNSLRIECIHLVEASEAKYVWRLLEVGEVIAEGDEYYDIRSSEWFSYGPAGFIHPFGNIARRRVRVVEVSE